MTDDPGISKTNSSTGNLDRSKQTNKPNKPWWLEPRWAGGRPPIEPDSRRAVAIQDKRVWEKVKALLDQCVPGEKFLDAYRGGQLVDVVTWPELAAMIPLAIALQLRDVHRRMLVRIAAAMVRFHGLGVIVPHDWLAEVCMATKITTRRAVELLVRLELVTVLPNHERHGAVHSRRGNGYVLCSELTAFVTKRKATPPAHPDSNRNEQASGTGSVLRSSAAAISPTLPEIGLAPPSAPPASSPPTKKILNSPLCLLTPDPELVEPDFPESRLRADESSVVACPETQDATRGVSESIERAGVGDGARAYAAMLAILDGGAR